MDTVILVLIPLEHLLLIKVSKITPTLCLEVGTTAEHSSLHCQNPCYFFPCLRQIMCFVLVSIVTASWLLLDKINSNILIIIHPSQVVR